MELPCNFYALVVLWIVSELIFLLCELLGLGWGNAEPYELICSVSASDIMVAWTLGIVWVFLNLNMLLPSDLNANCCMISVNFAFLMVMLWIVIWYAVSAFLCSFGVVLGPCGNFWGSAWPYKAFRALVANFWGSAWAYKAFRGTVVNRPFRPSAQ